MYSNAITMILLYLLVKEINHPFIFILSIKIILQTLLTIQHSLFSPVRIILFMTEIDQVLKIYTTSIRVKKLD
jgi:hypothetical protein